MIMQIGTDYIGISTPFYCNDGKGNFLFHKRKNYRDENGRWDPGSGKLDFGMTLEQNVLREIFEEYGCQGEIQERVPAHDIFREHEGRKTHWVAVPFFVKIDPKEAKMNELEKMEAIGWFRLDKLPTPLHKGFQYSFSKFPEYFEKYK